MARFTMRTQNCVKVSLYVPLAPLELAYCLIPPDRRDNASSRLCLSQNEPSESKMTIVSEIF